jgi:hypothetical protein
LIFFEVGDSLIAVSADSVSSFVPLADYSGPVPTTGFPDFMLASGIYSESYDKACLPSERFLMFVNNFDGTSSCYLTPPPSELVEYPIRELYPLPELIQKVSSVSNLSGYCLHKGTMAPIFQPTGVQENV